MTDDKDEIKLSSEELETVAGGYISQGDDGSYNVYDNEEVSVLFCNDEYIKELNSSYRNIDAPTDVLSFENDEEYEDEEGKWKCVGDIAISLDTLPVNAEYFNEDTNAELKRLLVHGLLHLNGMDHGEEHIEKGLAPVCEMLVLQENILEKLKDEIIIK